jgi:hypothetical protein
MRGSGPATPLEGDNLTSTDTEKPQFVETVTVARYYIYAPIGRANIADNIGAFYLT